MYLLHRREQFRMTSYSINVREIKRNQIYTENFCTNWTYTPDMINISMFDKKKIIQNFSAMVRDMILFRPTVSAMPRLILILIAESGTPANFFMKPATAVITLNHQDFFYCSLWPWHAEKTVQFNCCRLRKLFQNFLI